MGKKNRKRQSGAGESLTASFGKQADKTPPVSKYAKKLAARRAAVQEEAKAERLARQDGQFEKAAVSVRAEAPPEPASSGGFIPTHIRQSTTAMVTGAYRGGAYLPAVFNRVSMPPLVDQSLLDKPCFMVADVDKAAWTVTRYVGDLTAEGHFTGAKDTIAVGPASDFRVQRAVFGNMIDWAKSHGLEKADRTPYAVFGPGQNIYGQDRVAKPPRRFDR